MESSLTTFESALYAQATGSQIQPVLLSGMEAGLWPLSRESWPTQFVPLLGGKSALALALERAKALGGKITCVGGEAHRFLVQEAMETAALTGRQILEPVSRGSAASMCVAALMSKPEDLLLFIPADHHIPNTYLFTQTVLSGIKAAQQGSMVAFGVTPGYPGTEHRYLVSPILKPTVFFEKLTRERAQSLILKNIALWGIGVYLMKARTLTDAIRTRAPDIFEDCSHAVEKITIDGNFSRLDASLFEACRNASFESTILEKQTDITAVQFKGVWSNVSNWRSIATLRAQDAEGNTLWGEASALNATNTFIHAGLRPVVALGTDHLIIIDTPDAVLVSSSDCIDRIGDVVLELKNAGFTEASEHRRVVRPWGAYDSVDSGKRFQVKRLTVKPGAKLSLQMHHHRAEHWVVVQGTAKVTRDAETTLLSENQSIYIPLGAVHRLENPGKTLLEVIEVQSGSYLGEDDIVRFDDSYGRVAPIRPPLFGAETGAETQ